MSQNNSLTGLNYLALLSMFLFAGAGTFMNAAVQTMIDAWPQLSASTVRLVVSLPPLVSLPVMLLTGTIVGKKLSYRFCAIFGTLLIAVGGVAPFFISSSWTIVMVFRCILGVGVGFLGMRNAMIVTSVPQDKQAAYTGYGSAIFSLGGVISSPIVGILAGYSWKHPFLFDALAFIPVILMTFFLKEPEQADTPAAAKEEKSEAPKAKGGFGWRAIYYMVMMLLTTTVLYPVLSGLSTYMADKQIGNAALAGTILSVYTLGGVVANLVLAPIMKVCKQYMIAVGCIITAVGVALILFVPSVPTLFIGCALAGGCFTLLLSVFLIYNGRATNPAVMALASTIILAMLQLGIFASNYFIPFCHAIFHRASEVESSYLGCLIAYIIMAIIAIAAKVAPAEDYNK